jgi:tellurium resistance protein TerD
VVRVAVSLAKGGNVSLTKEAGGSLTRVSVGLGWDERTTTGAAFDLDASALLVGENGRVLSDTHFVFYGNLQFPAGATEQSAWVFHTGDVLDGSAEGDDESIIVNLAALGPEVTRIVFPVSIYDADVRAQNFGQVMNAYIRIVDETTSAELVRYDLTEDYSTETAMIFGEVYRNGTDWKFRAVGQGYASGLGGIARDFGVNVA